MVCTPSLAPKSSPSSCNFYTEIKGDKARDLLEGKIKLPPTDREFLCRVFGSRVDAAAAQSCCCCRRQKNINQNI